MKISSLTIILGGVIYLGACILMDTLPPFDPASDLPWQASKLNLLAMIGLTMALTAMTISGLWSIRKVGIKWTNVLLSLIGLGLLLSIILTNYMKYDVLSKSDFSKQNAESLKKLESIMATKDMPLEKKTKWSLMYAQNKYNYDGVKIEYIDPNGNLVDFEPSAEDSKNREVQIKLAKLAAWGKKYPLESAIYWAVVAVGCLIIGIFWPVCRQSKHT